MNILHSLPREDGFYMPAEFEPHEGCFLIWPERPDSWAGQIRKQPSWGSNSAGI